MSCATGNDTLTAALRETLERTGTMENIRAQLRTMVMRCLNECLPSPTSSDTLPPLPALPIENVLINELILEYLSFNGYNQTLAVFTAECQTSDFLGETFIRTELGLLHKKSSNNLAMLYDIVEAVKVRTRKGRKGETRGNESKGAIIDSVGADGGIALHDEEVREREERSSKAVTI
ncbi:hypothetical protein ACHAW5_004482 [Stephanodiscus triporus]|uniref:LisH domain-containing protein n=1 Tax=Stephanodiscus triporus TaxID=2934178 RepID=A0ABD3QZI2_9STRA